MVEVAFFSLKQRYSDTLRPRTWFGQFRELVLKAAVRNVNSLSNFGQYSALAYRYSCTNPKLSRVRDISTIYVTRARFVR